MASVCIAPLPLVERPSRPLRVVAVAPVRSPPVDSRVYARRRMAAVAVLVLTVIAVHGLASLALRWWIHEPGSARPGPPPIESPVAVHNAEPGETLWALAERWGPHEDIRSDVDVLVALNGSAQLVVGEPVRVPRDWVQG